MSIRILDNITTGYKPNVFSDFNVMNSKLSIKEEIRMETQMVCPDDYLCAASNDGTNKFWGIVFEDEQFRNSKNWQQKDETISNILKAKKKGKRSDLGSRRLVRDMYSLHYQERPTRIRKESFPKVFTRNRFLLIVGCLPGWKEKDIPYAYGSKLRTKLDEIHKITRERMKIKSNENKAIEKFSKNK
ncbi:hypothetical protein V1478_003292 [Vespula squamosa]|uniref:LAGLIDADG homing endonuclease n=1 Tax=Vespula squamosa TaxID=30214 RepID=A0ABD2BSA4_VESSQ